MDETVAVGLVLLGIFVLSAVIQIWARKSLSQIIVAIPFFLLRKIREFFLHLSKKFHKKHNASQAADAPAARKAQPQGKKRSLMDALYYFILSLCYIYCGIRAILYWQNGEHMAAIVCVVLAFGLGYVQVLANKISDRVANTKAEPVITGSIFVALCCYSFSTARPTKGDWATLCYDIAMLIVIVEQVFPIDEIARKYANHLECGPNKQFEVKYKIKATSVYAGIAAMIAQGIGTLLSLSGLDGYRTFQMLFSWVAICFAGTYTILSFRVWHWRKIFATEAADGGATAPVQREEAAAEKAQ